MSTIDEIRRVRLEKITTLHHLGLNPYPSQSLKDFSNADVVKNFKNLTQFKKGGKVIVSPVKRRFV